MDNDLAPILFLTTFLMQNSLTLSSLAMPLMDLMGFLLMRALMLARSLGVVTVGVLPDPFSV